MPADRVVIGKLKSHLKAARERTPRVVIDMAQAEDVPGEWAADETGAIEVVHTISPELKQRLDAMGEGARGLSTTVKVGLIILAIVIALAIAAALVWASMNVNRISARAGAVRQRVSRSRSRSRSRSAA